MMFVSTARFASAITESHNAVSEVDIMDETGSNVLATLDVVSGSTSTDRTQATRGSCHLTIQDPTGLLVPNLASDLLQPFSGFTLQLRRGIEFRDGTREMFPLGTFWPFNPQVNDTGDSLQIQVSGYDTSKVISRTRWVDPFAIAAGTLTTDAIRAVLDNRMSGLTYNITPTGNTVPAMILGADMSQNDPWADVQHLASADGMEVFFDERNVVVIRPVPDPDLSPVTAVYDDGWNSLVIEFDRQNNGDVIYTGVVVNGEGSGVAVPVRSERWRSDTSLRIPYFFTSSLITTQTQADNVADALMLSVSRAEYGVNVHAVPDPRQVVGDVVRVHRDKSKINDVFTIVQMTMPLDPETSMTFQTSQRRTPG